MKNTAKMFIFVTILAFGAFSCSTSDQGGDPGTSILVDHQDAVLADIPESFITLAKQNLHIAYGHTSHGSQLTTGMTGLAEWQGELYSFNAGGADGALDLREGVFGSAYDLGNPDRRAWESATRTYLAAHPDVNVVVWAWCSQVDGTESDIRLYLDLMDGLERDFPGVRFVYMTGHTDGAAPDGNVPRRNAQIRDYCAAHGKVLYDFADIESYDPDGAFFGDKLVNDACDYDSNGDEVRDRNWAVSWQSAHPGEWFDCAAAHTQPLNANRKAYAAWHLWARLAGWGGN